MALKGKINCLHILARRGGGDAIANILSGKVSPCGKLAETFPFAFSDTPAKKFIPPTNIII